MAQQRNDSIAQVIDVDADFAVKAADAVMTEIELMQIAADRASDERIKAVSQTIANDYEAVSDELLSIAAQKMITLPPVASEAEQEHIRDLQDVSAENFDRSYINMFIDHYDNTVRLYENASTDVKDSELQAHAAKHLPVLRRNQEHLKALRDSLGFTVVDQQRVVPVTY